MMTPMKTDTAVFGGGCFWCTEAVFDMLRGVKSVVPGYAGGKTVKPSYEAVCTGETGHAEVIKVDFDPSVITYEDLLTVFFAAHDPDKAYCQLIINPKLEKVKKRFQELVKT